MKLKLSFLAFTMVVAMQVVASPTVQNVTAKQRFPWNGLVDITCTVTGIERSAPYKFYIEAVQPDEGITNKVAQFWVVQNETKQSNFKVAANDEYHLIWDAKADLGSIRCQNMIVCIGLEDDHDKVQLWEGGPYWATTNIGAEKPEDYGYYFWWGDTVGYKCENNKFVASDGSNSSFSFKSANTPTYGKSISILQSEGWITSDGVLAPEHDAATAHWGNGWRMPTKDELSALHNNCEWELFSINGVIGYLVKGREAYASKSIFLPFAGRVNRASLSSSGTFGYYWSSVPRSGDFSDDAFHLDLCMSSHSTEDGYRYYGHSVRPVLGFTK